MVSPGLAWSDDRALLLCCPKAAVKGDKGAMDVKWDYTCEFVGHVAKHPIRFGSSPSPLASSVAEGRYFHPGVDFDRE
jgi:hypothetical protein